MHHNIVQNPSWWRRRSGLERSLVLLAAMVMIIAILIGVALIVFILKMPKLNNKEMAASLNTTSTNATRIGKQLGVKDEICQTRGCIRVANSVLNNMNPDMDPCVDFYEFACGGYVKNTYITDDKTEISLMEEVGDKVQQQLKILLEEPVQYADIDSFILVKALYYSCMQKDLIEKRGAEPIKNVITKIGGWPVLEGDAWRGKNYNWKHSIFALRELGYSADYIVDFTVDYDLKNATRRIIYLNQAKLAFNREDLLVGITHKRTEAYFNYMIEIAVFLGADRDIAKKELNESLQFEMQLANITLRREDQRNFDKLYNLVTIDETQEKYPYINWLEYINAHLPASAEVKGNQEIVIYAEHFLSHLGPLLTDTPQRTIANYIIWQTVKDFIHFLPEKARGFQLEFKQRINGQKEQIPRWKECVAIAASVGIPLGSMYIRKYFNEESKKQTYEIMENVKEEFVNILKEVDWMDDTTKEHALEKVAHMSSHIGYPDELLDDKKIQEIYDKVEVDENFYFEAALNITAFITDFNLGLLSKPVNKSTWISHSSTAAVNAAYTYQENSIQFPAAILQDAFFSRDSPRYMNYGAIGYVIGHEITHGFDDRGRQFDKEGVLKEWWDPETKNAFDKKAKCIIEQYSNFFVPEVNKTLDGVNTQGENIADNGGIKEAYLAYNKWVEKNGPELKLPGLPYTPQQMFWVSAANTWCSKYRLGQLNLRVDNGDHPPGKYRINGPLGNMDEFSKDYNCPVGSKMNPKHKCKVW